MAFAVLTALSQCVDRWAPGSTTAHGLAFFDAALETSVPTLLTALILLASGLLAVAVARSGAEMASRWLLLGIVLAGLALDEAIAMHEATIAPLRRLLDAGGVLYFTWVVPGALLAIAAAALFLPLGARLPAAHRRLFLAAGVLFLGGAIAPELAEGWVVDRHGEDSMGLVPLVTVEETVEMVGAVLLLYVLMLRLEPWSGTLRLRAG